MGYTSNLPDLSSLLPTNDQTYEKPSPDKKIYGMMKSLSAMNHNSPPKSSV